MQMSPSSIYNAVFSSSIMIVLLWLLVKNWKVLGRLKFHFLFLCLALIITRLLLPVEYFFTVTLPMGQLLPIFNEFLNHPLLSVQGHDILILHLLSIIWITGSIICFCKFLYNFFSLQKLIRYAKTTDDIMINEILSNIIGKHNSRKNFKVLKVPYLSTPMITGIFHPYIFLPDTPFSKKELSFILNHETAHYFHGDLWIKFILEFLSIIYWWNPFIYLFKKQVSKLLEIHTDIRITDKLDESEQLSYLECLLNAAKKRLKHRSSMEEISISFVGEHTTSLSQRINIILERQTDRKKDFLTSFAILPLFIICILSFFVIFEAYYITPDNIENSIELTEDNAYLVPNAENGYDVYYNGTFLVLYQHQIA